MVLHLRKYRTLKKLQLESQRDTLKKYKDRLENTESAKNLLAQPKTGKYGNGIPDANKTVHEISFYSSVDDLCSDISITPCC